MVVILLPPLVLLFAKIYFAHYLYNFAVDYTTLQLLIILVISPVVEESVFRGLLHDLLFKYSAHVGINFILINVVFVLLHVHKHLGAIYLLFIFVCGMILSMVKYISNRLIYTIFLHIYYNLIFIIFTVGGGR